MGIGSRVTLGALVALVATALAGTESRRAAPL